jgi:hypothetical protein
LLFQWGSERVIVPFGAGADTDLNWSAGSRFFALGQSKSAACGQHSVAGRGICWSDNAAIELIAVEAYESGLDACLMPKSKPAHQCPTGVAAGLGQKQFKTNSSDRGFARSNLNRDAC